MIRLPLLLTLCVLLGGCVDDAPSRTAISVTPERQVFEVKGRGELVPSESVSILMPSEVEMVFNILWLAPEYSEVKTGDVVARFDASEITNQRGSNQVQMAVQGVAVERRSLTIGSGRLKIDHELERVDGETDIAETYVEVDPRVFSQNQIIDAVSDLEYLSVQDSFYRWQADTHDRRSTAETMQLKAQWQVFATRMSQYDEALELMEVTSPADGAFVYATTPWGAKISRGLPVFAGRSIGLIPVKGKIRARIFIPEVEAIGLEVGQSARIQLDSNLVREYEGSVVSVSAVASAPKSDDPRRFFIVEADLEEFDGEVMRVGAKLTAFVQTAALDQAFAVPQQSVFFEQEQAFVYVIEGGDQVKRKIDIGLRSPTLIEVANGLRPGDLVSIMPPA
ncbi:MAG: hypothetical protein J4F97_00540 [Pseudomonadales bacterium]|nr:hypothetical protein [Pseudomonadales bacterium]